MHFQTVFASTHSTNPIFFSSATRRTDPSIQYCSNVQFRNGFCSFRKRVSESRIALRNHGGSIGIRCEGGFEGKDDGFYIRRCVELAKKAIGHTSPNPMVGCVLVKDGEVVGEGFHPKAGQPHAEVFALRDAGDLAENATAYVSLEPCNHFGRTPPCTEALIRAKVKRVVVGMVDPNPIVASKGVERLRESGIDVTVLVEEELCKKLNEAYIHRMLTGKPFVTLRYSLATDGEISGQLGEGAIELGGYYSKLLKEYDGVIMSSASLAEKSSFSTSQEPQAKQPLQIIVARNSTSPVQLPSLTTEAIPQVIIFAENNVVISPETNGQGIETVILDPVNLNAILDYCGQQGLCSVLLDLSGSHEELEELLQEGLQQGLVQKVVMEVVPSATESPVQALENMRKAGAQLKNVESWTSNDSLVIEGYFDKAGLY